MDENELNVLLGEEKVSGYQPLASIEFYEGALLAMDTLKKYGVSLEINVFECNKDSGVTEELFRKPELKGMDLFIGPVFNESLKVAAQFAKENEVFMISPLSPSANITDTNRYYIMANASITTQLRKTIEFLSKKYPKANFIVLHRTTLENEQKLANDFKNAFSLAIRDSTIATLKEVNTVGEIGGMLSGTNNFVFSCSNEEMYMNSVIRSLSKMGRGGYVTLLGLPGILSIESISPDYYENLNLHYPVSYWVDQNTPRVERFNNAFVSRFGVKPSDYAYRGYDLTLYFGSLLKMYGPDIASNISRPNPVTKSLLYQFNFQPCKISDSVRFYENENIIILRYDNYRFERAN